MPNVFVPSLRYRVTQNGNHVPDVDITPARKYGKFIYMSVPGLGLATDIDLNEVAAWTRAEYQEGDYLLAVGDFIAFSVALAAAHDMTGCVRVLRWDKHKRDYYVQEVSYDTLERA